MKENWLHRIHGTGKTYDSQCKTYICHESAYWGGKTRISSLPWWWRYSASWFWSLFFSWSFAPQSIHEFLREMFFPPIFPIFGTSGSKSAHFTTKVGIQISLLFTMPFPSPSSFAKWQTKNPGEKSRRGNPPICSKKKDKATSPERRVQQKHMSTLRISLDLPIRRFLFSP